MKYDELLPYVLPAMLGLVVAYISYVFIYEIDSAATDFRQRQVKSGDTSLAELYINLSPETFFMLRLILAIGVFFFTLSLLTPIFAFMLSAFVFMVPAFWLGAQKRKRVRKVETQLVDGLELLGNSLKSGMTLPQAVELLVREIPAPLSQEFNMVLAETRLGVDFNDALVNMAERLKSNIIGILASGVAVTKRCGGDLTVIFTNIAQTIREQANIEGKLDAVTAQGRFQGQVLGLMPFALVGALYFIDRSHVETLFGYQIGLWAMFLVVVMVVMAQLWIRKLLQIDV